MRTTALKLARIKAGILQKNLADSIGISVSMLSRLENGNARPSLKMLQLLGKILNISLDELAKDY